MANDRESAVERRRLLAALRRWRRQAELSQQQAASAMGWSLSKLIRLENGRGHPIPGDVLALLAYYGAPMEEAKQFSELTRHLPTRILSNEQALRGVFNPAYVNYLEFERGSRLVRQWHPTLVPGILQTEEYAYEVLTKAFKRNAEDARRIIDARMERQTLLDTANGPRFHFIIDEGILYRPVGTPKIMKAQIERILGLVERSSNGRKRVVVQTLPLKVGVTPGIRGPFILLEFEDDSDQDVLFLETPRGDFFSRDEKEDTEKYQIIFGELEELAMPIEAVQDRVNELLERFGSS